jgi:tetratricopeptide (TPR) repeat protein
VSASYIVSTGERNLIGDTVNLAARLERAAPIEGVLVGQSTYDQIRGLFSAREQPPLAVKGKARPVQTYLIYREKPRAFRMHTRGLAGITTRTVGRDAELAVLQETYRRALSGDGLQWVTVSGEAGVGKSRLLAEFEHWLELRPEQVWYLVARAWPQTERSPYHLLRGLLSFRFQIREGDPLDIARDKLTAGLTEVLGDELGEEAAAFVGQLVGFDFRHSSWIAHIVEDTRQIRGRAEVLLREYLTHLCATEPAVLLLEDLHWADEESLVLLSDILSERWPWQLCVIGLARPLLWERGVRWRDTASGEPVAHHCRLDLAPLSDELTGELARELLQKVTQPLNWLIPLLVERSAGNPYFAEELVHWLIEQGVIETGPDVWQVDEGQSLGLSVPGTVQGVLQARLERLGREERATLQRAAVVGRVFWDGAVEYIGQEAVLAERWEGLQQRDLVFRQPASQLPGEEEYHFKHVLLRDVVYEYTLKKLRRVFHKRAAEWLEEVTAERADEWAAVIAMHYEQARETVEAAEWYRRAGKQAQGTYAPEAAIGYYQKALEFLAETCKVSETLQVWARQREIYDGLGKMLRWQARYTEAAEAYTAMLMAAEAAGDAAAQARAWNGLSDVQDSQGDHRAALESAGRAGEVAQAAGAPVELARGLYNKGWAFMRLGNAEAALTLGEQALSLSAELVARDEVARSLNLIGVAYQMLGRYEQATHYKERSLALRRESGDRDGEESALNSLGEIARLRGDYRAAVVFYQKALTIAQEIGDRDGEMVYLSNLGGARVGLAEYRAAEATLRQVIHLAGTAGFFALSETYRFLAEALLGQEQVTDALVATRQALALGQETEQQEFTGGAWRALGMVAAQLPEPVVIGDHAYDAAACFTESLQVFTEMGAKGERARTLREWAGHEIEKGDSEKGAALWQKAREIFDRLGMELELHRMDTAL